jgi:hypothetical protein
MMDLENTNMKRRKPNKNKTSYVLLGELKYKAPKTSVELDWFNIETSLVFIQV